LEVNIHSARATRQTLFDFDPFALNFPSLCLHILKAPPSLFSATPFPSHDSWSIEPPGQRQVEALRITVLETLSVIKRLRLAAHQGETQVSFSKLDDDAEKVLAHITDAWDYWNTVSEVSQRETWQLETLRHVARTNDSSRKAEKTIDALRIEIDGLLSKLHRRPFHDNHSSETGYPFIPFPSYMSGASMRVSNETIKTLVDQTFEPTSIDHKSLIGKYSKLIRRSKRSSYPIVASKSMSDEYHTGSDTMHNCWSEGSHSGSDEGSMNPPEGHHRTQNSGKGADSPSNNHADFFDGEAMEVTQQLPPRLTLDLGLYQKHQNPPVQYTPPSSSSNQRQFRWPMDTSDQQSGYHGGGHLSTGGDRRPMYHTTENMHIEGYRQ
jgi:hypothetical protein